MRRADDKSHECWGSIKGPLNRSPRRYRKCPFSEGSGGPSDDAIWAAGWTEGFSSGEAVEEEEEERSYDRAVASRGLGALAGNSRLTRIADTSVRRRPTIALQNI